MGGVLGQPGAPCGPVDHEHVYWKLDQFNDESRESVRPAPSAKRYSRVMFRALDVARGRAVRAGKPGRGRGTRPQDRAWNEQPEPGHARVGAVPGR